MAVVEDIPAAKQHEKNNLELLYVVLSLFFDR
jgi:hypothetical protein